MKTVDGRRVHVLDQGQYNNNAGPDFFNAKINIDGELWGGDVEIHVKASDWYRHHHDSDNSYRSVILHVVGKDDAEVTLPGTTQVVPQIRLSCSDDFMRYHGHLMDNSINSLPCGDDLEKLGEINVADWITALAFERIIEKSERIEGLMSATTNNWEEVCYITLARALGTGTNGDPFQRLAMSVPLRVLGKHSDNLMAIESLLFGNAGLLDNIVADNAYQSRLKEEYDFLCHKFGLSRLVNLNWKMARMRPANFPHRRIALLAAFVNGGFRLTTDLLKAETVEDAKNCFRKEAKGYWAHHYNFSGVSVSSTGSLSNSTLESLVINVAVPFLYTYSCRHLTGHDAEELQDRIVVWLEQLAPEKNFITTMFAGKGLKCKNAFVSQAMIQLRRNYCENRKCIYCRIGHKLLSSKIKIG